MKRFVILAIGSLDYILSKTGNMLLRYRSKEVVSIIDPDHAGKTSDEVLGWGMKVPVVKSFNKSKIYKPTHLVIGNAPQGGILSDAERIEVIRAIRNKCNIISGMHVFLNEDKEIANLAKEHNIKIVDLRKPPEPPHFPKGSWIKRKFPVLEVVGSDCDTGKMTTAWEITKALKKRKRNVEFIGTGQTGILLSGKGVAVDAVTSDFLAGEVEYLLDSLPKNTELAIVEGQGALNNMYYSSVTLGLLHGAMPDYLVFTDEPNRNLDVAKWEIPKIKDLMKIHLDLLKPFKSCSFLGINLLTFKMTDSQAKEIIKSILDEFNIPATDLIRFKDSQLINKIEKAIDEWN
tara:strand:+ start:1569 stop:2606 length:1038 start_codon:yes stop_codon:yes gene_type:complete